MRFLRRHIIYISCVVILSVIILVYLTGLPPADGFKDKSPTRVAILFSGRIKGYEHVLENLKTIQNTYNPQIFCSLNELELTNDIKRFCEILSIPPDHVNIEQTQLPTWSDTCNLMNPTLNVYSMFYHQNKAFGMIENYMKTTSTVFDCILYYRADMNPKERLNLVLPEKNSIYIPNDRGYGGLNDRMAYGDYESMKIYCNLISSFKNLCNDQTWQPINAEKMLEKHLLSNSNIQIIDIKYNTDLHESRNDKLANGILDI